uniref:EF-hand domain-containing protein n=1 Tax=Macrostomum lignano TaxID=282301 RepID=A0A1I8IBX5_9PLAT
MLSQPVRSAATPKLRQPVRHTGQRDPDSLRSLNVTGSARIDVCSNLDLECRVGDGGGYCRSARRAQESYDARLQQKKLKDELITDSEIDYLIREKLRKEQYAVECLFRNADPSQCGRVHRNALLRILYSICGHIRFEQFHRLLDRLGLEDKQTVTFADFKAGFSDSSSTSPPSGTAAAPLIGRYSSKPVSVAHAFAMMRQRVAQPGFDLADILPAACFEPDGVVLKPQLVRALELLRIPLAPGDTDKFWGRLFWDCPCSSNQGQRTQRGPPRSKTAPSHAERRKLDLQQKDESPAIKPEEASSEQQQKPSSPQPAAAETAATPSSAQATAADFKHLKRFELMRKNRPFEEPYEALLAAFQHADTERSGRLAIGELQRVLREFGFPTADGPDSVGFDQFLIRFGLRPGYAGAVSYEDLLAKLQAKGANSLLSRYLLSDKTPIAFDEGQDCPLKRQNLVALPNGIAASTVSAQRLPASAFRIYKTGLVSEDAFRAIVGRVLRAEVPAHQLASVLARLTKSRNGAVQYMPPKMWAKQPICPKPPSQQQQKQQLEVAPSADSATPAIKEVKFQTKKNSQSKREQQQQQRSLLDLARMTQATLTAHFHQVDKLYKQMDRRNTGRISCKQFRSLLNALGLGVTEQEMSALWSTLDTSPDGQWSYRQMLRHFMSGGLQEAALMERLRGAHRSWRMSDTADPSVMKLRQLREIRADNQDEAEQQKQQQQPTQPKRESLTKAELESLIELSRPGIVANWDEIKLRLRRLDPQGTSCIYRVEFAELAREYQLPLDPAQLENLSRAFEKRGNGRFNYMAFLKRFVSQSAKPLSKTAELARTVTDKLLFEWKSLLLAFRKYDVEKVGRLSVHELRKIVGRCGYRLSEDDLFLLLSDYNKS